MNKIFNWLFGACFRTLGRFLAIFLVFVLLLFIGSKLDIKIPSWLALNVNASENTYSDYWGDLNNLSNQTASGVVSGYYGDVLSDGDNYFYYKTPKTPNVNLISNFEFPFYTNFYNIVNNYNSSNTNGSIDVNNALSVFLLTTNTNNALQSTICKIKENTGAYYIADCPIVKNVKNIRGFRVDLRTNSLGSYLLPSISIGFSRDILGYIDSNAQNNQIQQETNNKLDDVNQSIQDTNDTLNNNDISGAQDSAGGFFENFSTETFGLTSIITAPLNAINSIIGSTCSPLVLPLPFVNKNLSLPCMTSVYSDYFGGFFTLYQLITTGLISYYIIVRIFNLVKDFKNPEHDEIEVVDL